MVLEMCGGQTGSSFYTVSELIQRDLLGRKSLIFWISHLHPLGEQTILNCWNATILIEGTKS